MRQRGERIERSFAHLYDTGGMRRMHLRGHANILKRLLIHAGGFNLGLVMRHAIGVGTPRGLRDGVTAMLASLVALLGRIRHPYTAGAWCERLPTIAFASASAVAPALNWPAKATSAAGC